MLYYNIFVEGQVFVKEDVGFYKVLKLCQIQMIVIGGVIGMGLFLGVGGCLVVVGLVLVLVYVLCGFFGFLVLCVLGELIMYWFSLGLFVSYVCEFYGEKLVFVVGWMYWINWVMILVVDVMVVVLYMNFFKVYVLWLVGID